MNRLVVCIAIGAILLSTCVPAFTCITPLSESDMKGIMGQAGVSIWIKDIEVKQHVGEMIYPGPLKKNGEPNTTFIVFSYKEYETTTTYKAITPDTDRDGLLTQNYKERFPDLKYSPLKIDVIRKASLLARGTADELEKQAVVTVVATLPTLEITKTEVTQNIKIRDANAINNEKSFITITKGPSVMAIIGGTIEISTN